MNYLRKYFPFYILFVLSFWAVLPFFQSGLPNTHDGQTHVMRLASFHQALIDGQIPPRWAGNLSFGFGSPVLSFAFPLPYITGDLFHFLGFSFQDAIKLVFIMGSIFSGLTMYLFLRKLTASFPAFVGAALYIFAPYRFLDLYVRGDVGESLVFVFPPLVLWLLWRKNPSFLLASCAVGLMFLSHQLLAGLFSLIILIFLFFQKKTLPVVASLLGGIILAAFNLLPAIFEKKFTNLDFLTSTNYQGQFPTLPSIFYSRWSWGPALPVDPSISMSFQLGIAQWVAVVVLFLVLSMAFWQKTKITGNLKIAGLLFGLFLTFLFFMTSFSQFLWEKAVLLKMVLYPWRLLGVEVFLVALMSALAIHLVKSYKLKLCLGLMFILLAIYGNRNHMQISGRTWHNDSFYLNFTGTSDMWGEFLPRNTELPQKPPDEKVETTEGEAIISNLKIKSNEIVFNTENHGTTSFRVNNFYYPGWEVFANGQKMNLESSQTLDFILPEGKHFVEVKFRETLVRKIADLLSLFALIVISALFVFKLKRR